MGFLTSTLPTGGRMPILSDFDFDLPAELIAREPLLERSASRLLEVDSAVSPASFVDRRFTEVADCLKRGDLLVFNDTRVVKGRFWGQTASGANVEVLVERLTGDRAALAQIKTRERLAAGSVIRLAGAFDVQVVEHVEPLYWLHFSEPCLAAIERHGRLPLPPYVEHHPDPMDEARYQTVLAKSPGALAAPTAALHFDDGVFARLDARGIEWATLTLHVGASGFDPVGVQDVDAHTMHSEWYQLSSNLVEKTADTRARGGRVVAVGTSSLRALESGAREAEKAGQSLVAISGETRLFIAPGFRFRVADMLITNCHLPKSTPLILVAAFIGMEATRSAYQHAVQSAYRFGSYGDAMLLTRHETQ